MNQEKDYIDITTRHENSILEIHAVGKRDGKSFILTTVPALRFTDGICRVKCTLETASMIQRMVEIQQGFICNVGHDWRDRLYKARETYLVRQEEKRIKQIQKDADINRKVELEEFRRAKEAKEIEEVRKAFFEEKEKEEAKKAKKTKATKKEKAEIAKVAEG